MTNQDPSNLAAIMREQELQRRQVRRQIILNQAKLEDEELTPEETQIHEAAIKRIAHGMVKQEQDIQEAYLYEYKDLRKGYFAILWDAILGRI